LTGVASVSLKGVSATTPLIEREEGEPPTLKADLGASQDLMQAVHDALNNANAIIAENRESLHKAIQDLAVFTSALARNADGLDDVVNNTKQATASIRDLADHLDKRTDEITVGVNKMTESATKQINIVGGDAHRAIINIDRAVTDLAKNPQRLLFGGGAK
jgi:phospholipid/cholesterol/gamma-HCH transport system substrate-binding protein